VENAINRIKTSGRVGPIFCDPAVLEKVLEWQNYAQRFSMLLPKSFIQLGFGGGQLL
jgi:hypothetical protein